MMASLKPSSFVIRICFVILTSSSGIPRDAVRAQEKGRLAPARETASILWAALPGEVRKGLVGIGHAVDVLALGHCGAFPVECGQQLLGQLLVRRAALLLAAGAKDPAQRQRLLRPK